jgi:uncharacterized membrane-anchored protein YhcB (DUF1043 family)
MSVVVNSDNGLTEQGVQSTLAEARKQAAKSIETGRYKLNPKTNEELSSEAANDKLRRYAGYSMGVKPEEVDIDSGASLWERTKMDLLPDDGSRMEYIEKKYGAENVNAINVGGTTKMFYRDPKSNKMTMVDEMGASLADFTADIAGEAVTTAGAVGGAIAGTALAPGAGTGAGAVAGATAGAALGGFLTGVTQDVAAETLAGQEVEIGEIAKRRAIEAGIGIPIDLATAGVGRVFARGIAGKGAKNLVGEFDQAAKRVDDLLAKEGASLPQVEALRTGAGSKQASEIAAARPTSKLAKELQSVRDRIGVLRESLEGRTPRGVSADEFNRISEGIAENYRKLIDDVAKVDTKLANELTDQASRKMQKLAAPKVSEESIGVRIRELLSPGVKNIERTNRENWSMLSAVGKNVNVPIKSIINAIDRGTAKFSRTELPQAKAIIRDLKKVMKGKEGEPTGLFDASGRPILGKGVSGKDAVDFNEFKEIIDTINDVVSRNKEAGFALKERVATQILEEFTGNPQLGKPGLRGIMAATNPELGQAMGNALDYYKNNLLDVRRGAVGRTLREQLADPAITASQVAKLAIQDPAYIRQSLRIAKQGDPAMEKALKKDLQDLYLNRIGLAGEFDPKLGFTFNEDIVRELWGNRQVREMANLQKRLQQMKDVNIIDLEASDVSRYLNALSNKERSGIVKQIKSKVEASKRLDKMEVNQLTKMLAPQRGKRAGEWSEPAMTGVGLAEFANKFVSASTDQVRSAMKLIRAQKDPVGEQAFQQGYIGKLFDKFSGGAQVDRYGNPLWNPVAFQKAMKKGTREYRNAVEILGKGGVDDLLSANRVLLEASETVGKDVGEIFQPRYSLTSGGLQLYGVGNLIGGLRGRAMAWAYGSKNGSRLMRFLTNPGTDEATERELQKLLPALMTSSGGLKAAAIQGQFDPEFSERVAPLYQSTDEQPQQ